MTTMRLKHLTDPYSVVLYILQLAIAQVLPRNFIPDSDGESPGSSFLEELPEEHGDILGLHAPLLPLSAFSVSCLQYVWGGCLDDPRERALFSRACTPSSLGSSHGRPRRRRLHLRHEGVGLGPWPHTRYQVGRVGSKTIDFCILSCGSFQKPA
jgi:hypothetical protein